MAQGNRQDNPETKVESRAGAGTSTWPVGGARGGWAVARPEFEFAVPARLRDWAAAECGAGRLLPWLAVAYGSGDVLYFTAEREPACWAVLTLAALGAASAVVARRSSVGFPLALAFAALASGFAAATLHTAWLAHPVLRQPAWDVAVTGFVETREEREKSDRIVVHTHTIEGRRIEPAPQRVRVAVRSGTAPPVGAFATFKADLLPPLQPLRPGGYDFARDMYFPSSAPPASCSAASGPRRRRRRAAALGCATPRPSRACAERSISASAPSYRATRALSPRR